MISSSGEEEIYCICRSSDVNRFMIGCEHCNDWFHGDCVKVSEKEACHIERYFCKECRKKNPNLTIVYKSKNKIKEKERHRKEERFKERDKKHQHSSSHRHSEKHKHKDKDKDKEKEKSRGKKRDRYKKRDERKHRHKDKDYDRYRKHRKEKYQDKGEKSKVDSIVRAEPKDGTWKDGHVKLEDTKTSQTIKTEPQSNAKSTSGIKLESKKDAKRTSFSNSESDTKAASSVAPPSRPLKRERDNSTDSVPVKKRKTVLAERNVSDNDDTWKPPKREKKTNPTKKRKQPLTRRRPRGSSDEEPQVDLTPKQCFGPSCIRSARPNSKYCSDECGLRLASNRIYQMLPEKILQWNLTPCHAEKLNRRELEKIREKQEQVTARLKQLNVEFNMLEDIIAKGRTLSVEESDSDDDEDTVEMTVHCVTCGSVVQVTTAIRHMERCYNKVESQTSFASKFKTQIEDHRMFCDFYNPKEQSYCKRLQVLCPEHNPDSKVGDDEVCGYPLQKELFAKPSSFCLRAKKVCHMHFNWEKLRRAELDMERVKQWMKVDELLEQERQAKSTMSNRAGVLGLMLHSTFNHELDNRRQQQHMQQRAQQQRKMQHVVSQQKHIQKPFK